MIELTRRQRDVLARLQDLYREKGQPVHYTDLAQRLGINRFSAYDMLRVLEQKGAVGSQYVLSRVPGPGRPEVAFFPLARLSDGPDWEQTKNAILSRMRDVRGTDSDLLDVLLDDIAQSRSQLVYCERAMAALIVSLGQKARDYGRGLLAASTPAEGLDLFASLVLGLTLTGQAGRRLSQRLVECSERCQQYIAGMDTATREDLAHFVQHLVALQSS